MGEVSGLRDRSTSNGTPVDAARAVVRRITPGTIFDGKSEQDANCEVPFATGQRQSPTGSVRLSRSEDSNRMCCQRQTKTRHSGSSKIRYFGREFLPRCLVPGLSAQHRRHGDICRRSTVCSTLDMESQISSSILRRCVGMSRPVCKNGVTLHSSIPASEALGVSWQSLGDVTFVRDGENSP